jgi:hypothetical protein
MPKLNDDPPLIDVVLSLSDGRKQPIKAHGVGPFCVHPEFPSRRGWTVTSLSTGLTIVTVLLKEHAFAIARHLVKHGPKDAFRKTDPYHCLLGLPVWVGEWVKLLRGADAWVDPAPVMEKYPTA